MLDRALSDDERPQLCKTETKLIECHGATLVPSGTYKVVLQTYISVAPVTHYEVTITCPCGNCKQTHVYDTEENARTFIDNVSRELVMRTHL